MVSRESAALLQRLSILSAGISTKAQRLYWATFPTHTSLIVDEVQHRKDAIGGRHHCGVRPAIGLYANRSSSRTSANGFRAGCALSSNEFSACAASEPLELRWDFDFSQSRCNTGVRGRSS